MSMIWSSQGPQRSLGCSLPLPADILLEIASFLTCSADVLHLALVSQTTFDAVAPALYQHVFLDGTTVILTTLDMLRRRSGIAQHVRLLSIRPDPHSTSSRHYFTSSAFASAAVRELANTRTLEALHTIRWLDSELPFHDDMWLALRLGCPQLVNLTFPLGFHLPTHSSHVHNLLLSLRLLTHVPGRKSLWTMLQQCINLEELSILGISSIPADSHVLSHYRWPYLQSLRLGDVCVDWIPRLPSGQASKRPFVSFLEAHQTLRTISLRRATVQHQHLAALESTGMSAMTTFEGTLLHLQALSPSLYSNISSLAFTEPLQDARELRLCFSLHCTYYDASSLLRSLMTGAPYLLKLELACLQRPSFQIESFARTIRGFSKLRTLNLMIVRYPGDMGLREGAVLPGAPDTTIQAASSTSKASSTGFFAVTTDAYGLPLSLNARIQSKWIWPWGLGETLQTKRYRSDLRPSGTPGAQENGVISLFFERSSAGEEIRMYALCGALMVLAVCGFWTGRALSGN
ncbi:hypothetical protein DL96DRAFT_1602848 [Flagelloscypha sp. PMI_526]|nr:hypothetical protein DL96DRAFT_1602848 [Flagelloscypha sp. PMI_526]